MSPVWTSLGQVSREEMKPLLPQFAGDVYYISCLSDGRGLHIAVIRDNRLLYRIDVEKGMWKQYPDGVPQNLNDIQKSTSREIAARYLPNKKST